MGCFVDRKQLLKVARLGPKAFEQCAGFLRIRDGKIHLMPPTVPLKPIPLFENILQSIIKKLIKSWAIVHYFHKSMPENLSPSSSVYHH